MQKGRVQFFRSSYNKIELIFCKDSLISYSKHTHASTYTLGFVLDGTVEIAFKDNARIFCTGDFFVIPPNFLHGVRPIKPYSTLSVCLGVDYIYNYDEDVMFQSLQELTANLVIKGLITFEQISMLKDSVSVLYVSLSKMFIPQNSEVFKAKELLERKPENPFPIEFLAKQIFISPYYLIRTFKEELGLTPHQYQMQRRIRKAQYLLLQNNTIAEVASAIGFYDQSHFDKLFRKIVGITPTEYIHSQGQLSLATNH